MAASDDVELAALSTATSDSTGRLVEYAKQKTSQLRTLTAEHQQIKEQHAQLTKDTEKEKACLLETAAKLQQESTKLQAAVAAEQAATSAKKAAESERDEMARKNDALQTEIATLRAKLEAAEQAPPPSALSPTTSSAGAKRVGPPDSGAEDRAPKAARAEQETIERAPPPPPAADSVAPMDEEVGPAAEPEAEQDADAEEEDGAVDGENSSTTTVAQNDGSQPLAMDDGDDEEEGLFGEGPEPDDPPGGGEEVLREVELLATGLAAGPASDEPAKAVQQLLQFEREDKKEGPGASKEVLMALMGDGRLLAFSRALKKTAGTGTGTGTGVGVAGGADLSGPAPLDRLELEGAEAEGRCLLGALPLSQRKGGMRMAAEAGLSGVSRMYVCRGGEISLFRTGKSSFKRVLRRGCQKEEVELVQGTTKDPPGDVGHADRLAEVTIQTMLTSVATAAKNAVANVASHMNANLMAIACLRGQLLAKQVFLEDPTGKVLYTTVIDDDDDDDDDDKSDDGDDDAAAAAAGGAAAGEGDDGRSAPLVLFLSSNERADEAFSVLVVATPKDIMTYRVMEEGLDPRKPPGPPKVEGQSKEERKLAVAEHGRQHEAAVAQWKQNCVNHNKAESLFMEYPTNCVGLQQQGGAAAAEAPTMLLDAKTEGKGYVLMLFRSKLELWQVLLPPLPIPPPTTSTLVPSGASLPPPHVGAHPPPSRAVAGGAAHRAQEGPLHRQPLLRLPDRLARPGRRDGGANEAQRGRHARAQAALARRHRRRHAPPAPPRPAAAAHLQARSVGQRRRRRLVGVGRRRRLVDGARRPGRWRGRRRGGGHAAEADGGLAAAQCGEDARVGRAVLRLRRRLPAPLPRPRPQAQREPLMCARGILLWHADGDYMRMRRSGAG